MLLDFILLKKFGMFTLRSDLFNLTDTYTLSIRILWKI